MEKYSPVVLRLGLVFVFIWFGSSQLMNSSMWTSLIPSWITSISGMSAHTFVILNGVFEIVASILLAFGLGIRIVATLLFLHLAMIVLDLGLTAVGVRDVGLMFACLSLALRGGDAYSWDEVKML